MIDEGYIKFNYRWDQDVLPIDFECFELIHYRDYLYKKGLVGYDYDHDVSFGNISQRYHHDQFIISGTQTGHLPSLSSADLSHVISFNIEKNSLIASGPAKPSSESLTHAAIYTTRQDVNAVIHVHSALLWEHYYNSIKGISEKIAYGTPDLARAVTELVRSGKGPGVFLTKGHKDGIFAYGADLDSAFKPLQALLEGVKSS